MMRSFLPENKMNNSNDTLLRMMHDVTKVNIILEKRHQKFISIEFLYGSPCTPVRK